MSGEQVSGEQVSGGPMVGDSAGRELAAMSRALDLAASAGDSPHPNPTVGAVVLDREGSVVGEGWHERAGGPHAEIVALASAGDQARGGTVVVTLEPCGHTGRTPPCTDALLAAGVARVVVAAADPTAQAGGGAQLLRAAGVEVEVGLLGAEAERGNERWLTGVRKKRPYVVWKLASTLDGRVAAADGSSRWISSPESRADAHRLRATCDVIMAGVGTVLADDPALTVRDASGALLADQPLRVVLDSHGRTPSHARVLDASAPTWIATAAEVGADPGGRVDLVALLRTLHDVGHGLVLLEGGPNLAGAFVRAGLVDRVVAYVAPTLLGAGTASLLGTGITALADGVALEITEVCRCGPDVRITARITADETPDRSREV